MGLTTLLPPSAGASRMEALRNLWSAAGLDAVETREIVVQRTFADFEDFWTTNLIGASVRPTIAAMSSGDVELLKTRVRARLPPDAVGCIGLPGTKMEGATCGTIRLQLLKIGALVTVSVRRVKVAFASACPSRDTFVLAQRRLCARCATAAPEPGHQPLRIIDDPAQAARPAALTRHGPAPATLRPATSATRTRCAECAVGESRARRPRSSHG